MSLDDIKLAAQIESAQELALLGAVDHPEAILYSLYGTAVFPGQTVVDSVTGEVMEVVSAGIQTTTTDEAGS